MSSLSSGTGRLAAVLALLLALCPALWAAPTVEELEVYVKQHPDNIRAIYYLGKMYAQSGNNAGAIRLYMNLFKRPTQPAGTPNSVSLRLKIDLLNRIGFAYYKMSDNARAERVWSAALKHFPTDEFARKGLAAVARRRKAAPSGGQATSTGHGGQPKPAPAAPPKPKVSAADAKKAFDAGKKLFDQAKSEMDKGNDDGARDLFTQAREKFTTALDGDYSEAETCYLIGETFLKAATDDTSEIDQARSFFARALAQDPNDPHLTPDILFSLASAYGLLDDNENEIRYYEKCIEWEGKPGVQKFNFAEAHFRASLAYDKAKRADWSAKSFEHAKKAIKLDPNYKKKFQPMIRNSQVAKKVAGIIHEIIQKSEDSQIPDEDAAKYAEQIGQVLGDNNIKSEMLGDEAGSSPESLKEMIKDPGKRQKLRQFWDSSAGGDPQKVQDMIDHATPEQKATIDRVLSSDKNKAKLQQYVGDKLQEVNQQQE